MFFLPLAARAKGARSLTKFCKGRGAPLALLARTPPISIRTYVNRYIPVAVVLIEMGLHTVKNITVRGLEGALKWAAQSLRGDSDEGEEKDNCRESRILITTIDGWFK